MTALSRVLQRRVGQQQTSVQMQHTTTQFRNIIPACAQWFYNRHYHVYREIAAQGLFSRSLLDFSVRQVKGPAVGVTFSVPTYAKDLQVRVSRPVVLDKLTKTLYVSDNFGVDGKSSLAHDTALLRQIAELFADLPSASGFEEELQSFLFCALNFHQEQLDLYMKILCPKEIHKDD